MDNKLIMQSLPLVAAVLGDRYGVKVDIGGSEAATDGKVIKLPSLPVDCDETLLGLARGYTDHESAHIRETDFTAIKEAKLTPLENHIMNSIEDWRVENKLADLFPGSRGNFNWLIRHFFSDDSKEPDTDLIHLVPNLILLTVRSWDVPEVAKVKEKLQESLEKQYPNQFRKLEKLLEDVRLNCSKTADSIDYARKIISFLENELKDKIPRVASGKKIKKNTAQGQADAPLTEAKNEVQPTKEINHLFSATKDQLPQNIGEILSDQLSAKMRKNQNSAPLQVAQVGVKSLAPFLDPEMEAVKRSESLLKVRLGRVLQAQKLKRHQLGRRGKISSQSLPRIAVSDPKVFSRKQLQPEINTAVHLLLDTSGSMRTRIDLASQVCCAMAKALDSIIGISVGVTAFPTSKNNGISVAPVVRHGESVHSEFSTTVYGSTPLGSALWWVLQQLYGRPESRKIILVITDGAPDDTANVKDAVRVGKDLGVELYGIGINSDSVKRFFPHGSCRVDDLTELAPVMYTLLSGALVHKEK